MPIKYDSQSKHYNHTRTCDPYILDKFYTLLNVKNGNNVLDIGCGTGNYTIGLSKKGLNMIGVDPSMGMLRKAQTRDNNIEWIKGTAENLPFAAQSVDHIMACLTIHHWTSLGNSLKELFRVLKPEGRLVIFTSTPEQMKGYWLNYYFPEMMDYSMAQMPSFGVVESLLKEGEFSIINQEKYFIRKDLQDLFLYSGKYDPAMYLDLNIRKGISSFSLLANKKEINHGLQLLETDIKSGRINLIVKDYVNDLGDYLFIVAN